MCILTSTITRGNIQPVKSRKMHYRNYPRLHSQSENRQTSRDIGQWPSLQALDVGQQTPRYRQSIYAWIHLSKFWPAIWDGGRDEANSKALKESFLKQLHQLTLRWFAFHQTNARLNGHKYFTFPVPIIVLVGLRRLEIGFTFYKHNEAYRCNLNHSRGQVSQICTSLHNSQSYLH